MKPANFTFYFFRVLLGIVIGLIPTFYPKSVLAVACSGFPAMTNSLTNQTCVVAGITGVDDPQNIESSVTNGATLILGNNSSTPAEPLNITINSGGSLVTGSLTIKYDVTIAVATSGAQMLPGGLLYVVDADADGWVNDFTNLFTATAAGRRRLGLMRSFTVVDSNDSAYNVNNCGHTHCRDIAITYSGGALTNTDILVQMDTATPIAASKMTSDCGDIRLWDADGTTALSYWIESGCNTSNTQIWVRVPSITANKTIYMGYDGSTTTDGFTSWSGNFNLLYNAACPSGWTRNTSMDNKYFMGDPTTYGTTGGSSSHTPADVSGTSSDSPGNITASAGTATSNIANSSHTHSWTVSFSAASVQPPYLDMVMCKKTSLDVSSGLISLFDTTVPSGWTRFSSLDNLFARSAATYGGTGGASTHSHAEATISIGAASANSKADAGSNGTCATTGHTATVGTTSADSNVPPYMTMIFGSADSATVGTAAMIAMTDVIPPYGWTQFSALDSKLPFGGSTYGATGGATTHTHTGSVTSAQPSQNCNAVATNRGRKHSTTFSYTTAADSNLPPYSTVIFIKRNSPVPTTNTGSEY